MGKMELILHLYRDDVLLAVLSNIQLDDWPWYRCDFQSTTEFEQFRHLFDRELELLEDEGATEEWDSVYAKIEELNLRLVDPTNSKTTELFLVHVEDNKARFKAHFD